MPFTLLCRKEGEKLCPSMDYKSHEKSKPYSSNPGQKVGGYLFARTIKDTLFSTFHLGCVRNLNLEYFYQIWTENICVKFELRIFLSNLNWVYLCEIWTFVCWETRSRFSHKQQKPNLTCISGECIKPRYKNNPYLLLSSPWETCITKYGFRSRHCLELQDFSFWIWRINLKHCKTDLLVGWLKLLIEEHWS